MTTQREWIEKDFYKILGVSEDASEKDITKAYRKLARDSHPDANPEDSSAEDRFKEYAAAYDVIGDPDTRKEYDDLRKLGPVGGFGGGFSGSGGGFGNAGQGGGGQPFNGDIGDILGGLFGQRGGSTRQPNRAEPGDDLEAQLHLSFADAVSGVTTSVHLTSDAPCSTCHGSGSRPGSSPQVCGSCSGRGVLDDNQGLFSFSQPCPACAGRGRVVTDPCPTCRASGLERRPRQVKVRVPAGVKNGQRIRLKGRGGPGRYGGPHGDLFVIIEVAPHKIFGRKGAHLTLTVPVTFSEAALGAKVSVPTMEDGPVTLRIPAGTPTGKTFRVKGKGVAKKSGRGDLLVTVDVAVPQSLSDEQTEAIKDLADLFPESPRAHLDHANGDGSE